MSRLVRRKGGGQVVLLTPNEKASKFRGELKTGIRKTNSGQIKENDDGNSFLTHAQKSYRWGYLDRQKDVAKAHAYMKNKKKSNYKSNSPKKNVKKK